MSETQIVRRDPFWDVVKCVLIFLVVYGHVLTIDRPDGSINRAIFNLIFLFHMPLFIFISGRFSQMNDRRKYLKGIVRLLETYIVFQFLHIICRLVVNRGSFSIVNAIIYPEMTMWYLQCLIYWRLFVLLVPSSIINQKLRVLIGSFVVCIIAGFLPVSREFSIQRALCFSPCFFLGYYSFNIDIKNVVKRVPLIASLATFIMVFIVIYFWVNKDISMVLSGAIPYIADGIFNNNLLLGRFCFMIFAIILSVSFLKLTPENKYLSKWGRATLFVYMYHLFFEAVLKIIVHKGYLPDGFFPILFYSVVLMLFLLWCSNIRLLNIILNPISYLIEKKIK